MICKKCGGVIEGDSKFCPLCGARIEPITVTASEVKAENDTSVPPTAEPVPRSPFDPDAPIVHESMTSANSSTAYGGMQSEAHRSYYRGPVGQAGTEPPGMPSGRVVTNSPSFAMCHTTGDAIGARAAEPAALQEVQPVKPAEKSGEFFGVGAFVLCLCAIGVLAVTAGIFAFLYFRAIGLL